MTCESACAGFRMALVWGLNKGGIISEGAVGGIAQPHRCA